ncbi:MAG: ferredoxin [Caldimonas sp.]|nr:ferredoxin [Pseudomonadota bacterium]
MSDEAEFVILTDKPGIFHTEIGVHMHAVECWDYVFFGRTKARFVIAALDCETRIEVIDEAPPPTVSRVPSKLLKKYATVAEAKRDLDHLIQPGNPGTALVRVDI